MSTALLDRLGRPYTPMMDPALRLGKRPANAGKKYPAEVLGQGDLLRLMRAFGGGVVGVRNRAAVVAMWRAGLRLAECLDLDPRDVDLRELSITVRDGKGGKRRVVGLDPWGAEVISEWVQLRAELVARPWEGALFVTVTRGYGHSRVQAPYFREAMKAAGYRAEVAKRVHPHGLRHTFAAELMREGFPLRLIQQALGHNDLRTTAVYLDHLWPHELIERMADRPRPTAAVIECGVHARSSPTAARER